MAVQLTETEQFSVLVGDLYDAAVVPALWPEVLGKIADFVEGQSAALLTKDLVSTAGNAHYTFGCDPHYLQLFLDGYWRFDPTTPLLFFAPDPVASIADLMPYDDYLETRFHQEWARPQGWVDWISAVLEKSATRKHPRDRRNAWDRRDNGQDASWARLCQDRRQRPCRSG